MAWTFFSNHGLVLLAVARRPSARIRDLAGAVGITERAAQSIVNDLVREGYLERVREGRRNRYVVRGDRPLRHVTTRDHLVAELVQTMGSGAALKAEGRCDALVLSCSDLSVQPALHGFLAARGLLGRAELVLWPGGGPALTGPDRDLLFPALAMLAAERQPERLLLLAHSRCRVPNVPRAAGSDVLEVYRAVHRWAERIVAESRHRIGQVPELWFLTEGGASQVRVGAARPVRGRHMAAGKP
jgi:hypothetical protein